MRPILHILTPLLAIAALASAHADEHPEREFTECPDCSVMVAIPGGAFAMGSPASEAGRFDQEGPQHKVTVKAFALAKYPVTVEQYEKFLEETGYTPAPCDGLVDMGWKAEAGTPPYAPFKVMPRRWPATCLDHKDAHAYIGWLNGKLKAARPGVKNLYRLPSEAEWEYAARAGTVTARWWGEAVGKNNANCNGCASPWDNQVLADVDAFAANPFGLYGMLGNVWQWTEDCWHKSYVGAPSDGRAWVDGSCTRYALRGGAWNNLPIFVRSAARVAGGNNGGDYDYSALAGFRLARSLP